MILFKCLKNEGEVFMKFGVVISTTDPETVFNAIRLANFSAKKGDETKIFLLGKGVEIEQIESEKFDVKPQIDSFLENSGEIMACGTCLKLRNQKETDVCPISTMNDLYELINDSDKVVTF